MAGEPDLDLTRSRAVLIGTWDYADLPAVPAVEHSFTRMVELLTSEVCSWPAERVTQWTNVRQPADLPRQLVDLFGDAEDVALFYYVGHGQPDDRGRLCLGLVETRSEARFRSSTSLRFEDVRTALHYSNARTKIVLLDCCFAGLATQPEAALGVVDVADRAACEGAYTMAASAEFDVARYEQSDGRTAAPQTYFTKCFADVVHQGVADAGPTLSLELIFRHMVSTMWASHLAQPTQANRGTAATFPFCRNMAAVRWTNLPDGVVAALRNPLADVRGAVVSTLAALAGSDDPIQARAASDALDSLVDHDPDEHIRGRAAQALADLPSRLAPVEPIDISSRESDVRLAEAPPQLYTGQGGGHGRFGLRSSRLPMRWRMAIASVVLALVAVAAVFVLRADDQPSGGTAAPTDYRPTGSEQERIDNRVKPPPLSPGARPPSDSGNPDANYALQVQCVTSLTSNAGEVAGSWGQTRFDFPRLHKLATGKEQTVAVIDTGVNLHDFLQDRLAGLGDYVAAADNGLQDCDGHGTAIAGLIAANTASRGQDGFQGVAPDATVLSIRQSSANYTTRTGSTERTAGTLGTLAEAIIRAADAGANVINISVGGCRSSSSGPITGAEQVVQAALRYAVEVRDVVVVVAAGDVTGCGRQNPAGPNSPDVIPIPAWFSDDVLAVAAVAALTSPDLAADFSVRGPWVSVAAPGTEITTLDPASSTGLINRLVTPEGRPNSSIEGTGYAAAYVSGLAALIRQYRPKLNARQVMNRIKVTAQHPNVPGGWTDQVGFGTIQPVQALEDPVPGE